MSLWRGGLWGSQRYPNGGGPWRGGLWASQRAGGGGGGGGSDPLWDNVVSLLHMDTVGTVFTDEKGHTWTPNNGAQIVSDAGAFGGAHGDFTDASNNAYIELTTDSSHQLVGEFVIEFRFTPTATAAGIYYYTHRLGGAGNIWLYQSVAGEITFMLLGANASGTATVTSGQTYDVAIERDSAGTIRFYVDGQVIGTRSNATGEDTSPPTIQLGSAPSAAGSGKGGRCYIDEFRMTIGATRYEGVYTPATEPFPGA